MSKAGTNDNEDSNEEEEEEDEAEEEEHFYESLDRILSSSNSSTSASEDDDVAFPSPCNTRDHNHHHYHSRSKSSPSTSTPKFPMSAGGYDIWISDAAFSSTSVLQQRRDRLLSALGLSSDRTLSRSKQASNDNHNKDALFSYPGRSNSLDLHNQNQLARTDVENSAISCFKSEDYASTCQQSFDLVQCQHSSSSASTTSSNAILSIRSVSHTVNTMIYPSNYNNGDVGGVGSTHLGSVACLNEPSSDKFSTRMLGEIQSQSHCPSSDCTLGCDHLGEGRPGNNDGSGEGVDCSRINDDAIKQMCTIKNLDTGKEFVVNEVREDGMLQKLREVGTGRQLTMEEFEHCVGHSPIVQELMRRQNVECSKDYADPNSQGSIQNGAKSKKKVSWLKSIKNVASSVTGHKERRSSDEKDTSSEKCGGRRSSSATDDSQDVSFHGPERVRVRQYSKSVKEFTALYKSQDIQAHNGSIWCIKFSLDGRYLASAGEDCVIHVWQVVESERKGDLLMDKLDDASLSLLILANGSPELNSNSPNLENRLEKKRRGRASISRKSTSLDYVVVPEMVFGLSEKPICSFEGHSDDVLDLSWSKSQLLLSSSMDKTVRLWNLSSRSCLKTFSHSDYVTCIQFNPVDDRYFISGSLDAKVRIWSIPDRQVVDWCDLHEMVTAACYTPDGQGALVGSYKGSCRLYNASENKLQPKHEINLQNKKKKSHLKKITGFQFSPGSSSEVLITSADSRVRVVDGIDLVHKFKGFRNTNSQISASLTANGKYVVCASEDSHVYVWKHEADSSHRPGRSKGVTVTRSYEHFHCQDVSVAIPWPGTSESSDTSITTEDHQHQSVPFDSDQQHLLAVAEDPITVNHPSTPVNEFGGVDGSPSRGSTSSPFRGTILSSTNNYFFDRIAPTWPEEKLLASEKNSRSPRASLDFSNGLLQNRSAWGLVIVTAGLRGEIRTYQNFGLPVRT